MAEPADLIDAGRRLRRLAAACDDVGFVLDGAFDLTLEPHAARLRSAVAACATRAHSLLEALEKLQKEHHE